MSKKSHLTIGLKAKSINVHQYMLGKLGLIEKEMIYLEGGLGSQILGTLEFINTNKSVDISYFTNPPRAQDGGPDVWKWELGRYGIELSYFQARLRKTPYKWQYFLKPQIKDLSLSTSQNYINPWSIRGGDLFPVDKETTSKILSNYGIKENGFGAVHIRKGDYLRVSSRVISIDQYATILNKLRVQLPKEMFIFSDTPLQPTELEALKAAAPRLKMTFLSEDDLGSGTVHDLMRSSQVLITANSTFSFSAGILASNDTVVYCPMLFFGGQDDYLKSRIFNQTGDYFVMR